MRRLALFSLAFALATAGVRWLLPPAAVLPLGVVCALLALGGALLRRLRPALVCLGLAAALCWAPAYDALVRAPSRGLEGRTATLTAQVASFPRANGYGVSVPLYLNPGARAILYLDPEYGALKPGDVLTFTAYFRPSDRLRDRDTDTFTAKGIFLLAYPKGEVTVAPAAAVPWYFQPEVWRENLRASLAAVFPPDAVPLVRAVLLGDGGGMPDHEYVALQRAGVAHTVAVSGMHVSFLAAMLFQLSGRYQRRTALLAVPLLAAFALLTGCSPSVVRAVLMQSLLLLAPLLGRESDSPTSLGAALLVLLLQNPYAIAGIGLQLSFVSVAGILLFSQGAFLRMWRPLPWKNTVTRLALSTLAATFGALSLTTPLLAYYFGGISLIAPLGNVLILWAVSALFLGGLLAGGAGLVSIPLGSLLAAPVAVLARYIREVSELLSRLPFAAVGLSSPYLLAWAAFGYGLFLLWLLWPGRGKGLIVPACCGVLTLCAALLLTQISYRSGPLTLTVLNVGQGQSVVLRAGNRTALLDCGGNGWKNAGDLAADYLSDRGRGGLDLLILTHFHADHANGVPELLERIPVSVLAVPEGEDPLAAEILAAAEAKGTQIVTVTDDLHLTLGTAALTLYAPLGAGDSNEAGLSVLCGAGKFSALFTGDMDGTVERRLVKYGHLPDVDLLMAGHHGARASTSPLLLETVRPEAVTVSSGYNSYGHPNPAALLRAAQAGAALYRTDLQGNITITVRR